MPQITDRPHHAPELYTDTIRITARDRVNVAKIRVSLHVARVASSDPVVWAAREFRRWAVMLKPRFVPEAARCANDCILVQHENIRSRLIVLVCPCRSVPVKLERAVCTDDALHP